MISVKWDANELVLTVASLYLLLSGKCGSWVTNVGTENLISDYQDTDTGRSWESQIYTTFIIEAIGDSGETFIKLLFDLCGVNNTLIYLCLVESVFDVGLNFLS